MYCICKYVFNHAVGPRIYKNIQCNCQLYAKQCCTLALYLTYLYYISVLDYRLCAMHRSVYMYVRSYKISNAKICMKVSDV